MRSLVILLIVSLFILIVYFRKDILSVSEEISLPDQNPELVSYLQGDWAVTEDPKSVFQIKRDTIKELYNDTLRSAHNLYYVFSAAANKYFTNENSFSFSSQDKKRVTYDFRLREVNNKAANTEWDTIVFVSKLRLDLLSRGRIISFSRIK